MELQIPTGWSSVLHEELEKEYYIKLSAFLDEQYEIATVYPARGEIFRALELTSFANTKVVILGQDPYYRPNQAHGLSFSVQSGTPLPPSLKNILKELEMDLGKRCETTGCLEGWARQGVLLLNAVLTVREGEANAHQGKGWEHFTDAMIRALDHREEPVIFLLWGNFAKKKMAYIQNKQHIVLTAAHPSPLSARTGFFGSKPFSKINEQLRTRGEREIDWFAIS